MSITKTITRSVLAILLALCVVTNGYGRMAKNVRKPGNDVSTAEGPPAYGMGLHDIGLIKFGVSNNGTIDQNYAPSGNTDFFTGEQVPSLEYPKGSNTQYLFGAAFWIGAIVGNDTLVSVGQDGWTGGAELHPTSFDSLIWRSTIDPSKPEFEGAISEQDYIAVYLDTFTSGVTGLTNDVIDNRPHIPIGVEITQRSFAWSYSYADDFVLFDYQIKNVNKERLKKVFLGIYVDADVMAVVNQNGFTDDICGFIDSVDATYLPRQCPDKDGVFLAYIADNDGDLKAAPGQEVPHVTGVRIVRTPSDSLDVSFNWWVGNGNAALDFGPQTKAKKRDLSTGGTGTPEGDRNKYWFLSNGEFDYDQIRTATRPAFDDFLPPNEALKNDLADGFDTRYLLSFGPFDIEPGQVLPLSFAYVGGFNFHTDPNNGSNLPLNPDKYLENVNFDSLALNSTWAEWIYDNPGVDTDSDGYAGVFYPCTTGVDTLGNPIIKQIARKGDNVPDFRGASPPPAPLSRVEAEVGKVRVRWNGTLSETAIDNFSGEFDFEGYRVYLGRDDRRSSLSMIASMDFEDYNKWVWDDSVEIGERLGGFILPESPLTLDSLRILYAPNGINDSIWHPATFPRNNPFTWGSPPYDSLFYFAPQDFNQSTLGNYLNPQTTIRKIDTTAIKPELAWIKDFNKIPQFYLDSLELRNRLLTPEGTFLFYEYELTITDLLPSVPYWINVTSFDYGSPQSNLASLETSPTVRPIVAYAIETSDKIQSKEELNVYIWPNPYRLDGDYRSNFFEGFEDIDRTRPDDRVRRIHFGGLPPKCTISIFSLDGDLVREIDHDISGSDPLSTHDSWDLITRNTQLAVSGLYYWVVETPEGKTQIGKLVLIM